MNAHGCPVFGPEMDSRVAPDRVRTCGCLHCTCWWHCVFASGGEAVPGPLSTGADGCMSTFSSTPEPAPTPTEAPMLSPVEQETNYSDHSNETQRRL